MNWMLSQFVVDPDTKAPHPVCAGYSLGFMYPEPPEDLTSGWALVKCSSSSHQIEAAMQDPRVCVYHTLWDVITPETVGAYKTKGAIAGMMLGSLVALLAQSDPTVAWRSDMASQ
jgi:hypothetical protein